VKPLDGGALTVRWTRGPARGLAVAPLAQSPPVAGLSLSLGVEKKQASWGGEEVS
jgi:hypothetical protein